MGLPTNRKASATPLRSPDRIQQGVLAAGAGGIVMIEDMDGYDKLSVFFSGGSSQGVLQFYGCNDLKAGVWVKLWSECHDVAFHPGPSGAFQPSSSYSQEWTLPATTRYIRLAVMTASGNAMRWVSRASQGAFVSRKIGIEASWYYSAPTGGITSSTAVPVKAAPGNVGQRNLVTSAQFSNGGATGTEVAITDGDNNTLWRTWLSPGASTPVLPFDPPLVTVNRNKAVQVVLSAASGAAVYANLIGSVGL